MLLNQNGAVLAFGTSIFEAKTGNFSFLTNVTLPGINSYMYVTSMDIDYVNKRIFVGGYPFGQSSTGVRFVNIYDLSTFTLLQSLTFDGFSTSSFSGDMRFGITVLYDKPTNNLIILGGNAWNDYGICVIYDLVNNVEVKRVANLILWSTSASGAYVMDSASSIIDGDYIYHIRNAGMRNYGSIPSILQKVNIRTFEEVGRITLGTSYSPAIQAIDVDATKIYVYASCLQTYTGGRMKILDKSNLSIVNDNVPMNQYLTSTAGIYISDINTFLLTIDQSLNILNLLPYNTPASFQNNDVLLKSFSYDNVSKFLYRLSSAGVLQILKLN